MHVHKGQVWTKDEARSQELNLVTHMSCGKPDVYSITATSHSLYYQEAGFGIRSRIMSLGIPISDVGSSPAYPKIKEVLIVLAFLGSSFPDRNTSLQFPACEAIYPTN